MKLVVSQHVEGGRKGKWVIRDQDGNVVEGGFETQQEAKDRKAELESA